MTVHWLVTSDPDTAASVYEHGFYYPGRLFTYKGLERIDGNTLSEAKRKIEDRLPGWLTRRWVIVEEQP